MTWWVNYYNFHLWVNYLFKLGITHQCLCDRVGRPLIPLKTCRLHRLSPPPMASAHHLSTHLIIIIIMTQANFLPSSRLLYHFYLTLFYFQFRTTQLQTLQPAHRGGENVGREREEQKSDGLWAAITGRRAWSEKRRHQNKWDAPETVCFNTYVSALKLFTEELLLQILNPRWKMFKVKSIPKRKIQCFFSKGKIMSICLFIYMSQYKNT